MGIDIHALQLLKHNQKTNGKLGRTHYTWATFCIAGAKLAKKWVGTDQGAWCEDLLMRHFGATEVDSIDNSHYEGAKIILITTNLFQKSCINNMMPSLTLVVQNIFFNVAQVFKNTADICKIGGNFLQYFPLTILWPRVLSIQC